MCISSQTSQLKYLLEDKHNWLPFTELLRRRGLGNAQTCYTCCRNLVPVYCMNAILLLLEKRFISYHFELFYEWKHNKWSHKEDQIITVAMKFLIAKLSMENTKCRISQGIWDKVTPSLAWDGLGHYCDKLMHAWKFCTFIAKSTKSDKHDSLTSTLLFKRG